MFVFFSHARKLAGVLSVAAVLSTACAAGAATSPVPRGPVGPTRYPLSIDNCGRKVVFRKPPSRVLLLNGTSVGEAESFVFLGLQGHVLANAQSYPVSDDPGLVEAVKALPTGGLRLNRNFDVPAEQVLTAKPDLVVSTWSGGFEARSGFATRDQLARAGIASLVNPVNCALGRPDASTAERSVHDRQSIESSFDFLTLLGQIFDVQVRAAQTVARLRGRIEAVRGGVSGRPVKRVAIVYPGMSMMNANGLPAVMTGGIYDDVIKAAGGVNSFAGRSADVTRTLNKEQLAAAQVDVLAVGQFQPGEDPAAEARKLFAAYPQWSASRTRTYAVVSDGVYFGPVNAWAVEKLAKVIHGVG